MATPPPSPGPGHEVLVGLVERVTCHNAGNGFCVLRVKGRGHRDLVTLVGHAATISAGEWLTVSGEWVNDHAHGQRFRARFLGASAPTSIKGIGTVRARRIPTAWAEQKIMHEIMVFLHAHGVGTARAVRI